MVTYQLVSAGMTDRGQKRAINEDTILNHTGLDETGGYFGFYIVCDGLGGHHAGEVASRMAVRIVARELQSILPPKTAEQMNSADINHTIWTAVEKANEDIWHEAGNAETQRNGMGTTLTMAVVINDHVYVAHVGDSRLYLLRDGGLYQLTQDHTLAAALAEAGSISKEELIDHPRQNILTKALGRREKVEVELRELPLFSGDTLILCSDGFWKAFKSDDELEERLNLEGKTADLCKSLLMEANDKDGSDNISLILVTAKEQILPQEKNRLSRFNVEPAKQAVMV